MHGWIVPLDMPVTTDFASFYAAGDLTNSGMPQAAYDVVQHYAAEQRLTEPGVGYVIFVYPPSVSAALRAVGKTALCPVVRRIRSRVSYSLCPGPQTDTERAELGGFTFRFWLSPQR